MTDYKDKKDNKEFVTLESGTYKARLKIKEVQVPCWGRDANDKPFKTEETRDGFRLVWKVEDQEDAYITKDVAESYHSSGNMWKLCQSMTGSLLKEIKFHEDDTGANTAWIKEQPEFREFFMKLSGRLFNVQVIQNEGKNGKKYHNFKDVEPVIGEEERQGDVAPPVAAQTSFAADDIDFGDDDLNF